MSQEKIDQEYLAIAKIQVDEQDALLAKANVVGVGVGHKIKSGKETGDPCLSVLVSQKLDPAMLKANNIVPKTVGKFNTDVVQTGEIFAEPLTVRRRPAKGGYSVGHLNITAGTIGTVVTDFYPFPGIPPKYYILSNNHVLANSNNAAIGDSILQPGPYDGGQDPEDRIATLSRFVTIHFDGSDNYVDAAIAEGGFHDLDREIYWIGPVQGCACFSPMPPLPPPPGVRIGDIVQKCGRTTSYTTGKVTQLYATVNVNYGGGHQARFVRQIVTTSMSDYGDSGSLVLDLNGNAVGLLFAGSPGYITCCNEIYFVRTSLNIRIAGFGLF